MRLPSPPPPPLLLLQARQPPPPSPPCGPAPPRASALSAPPRHGASAPRPPTPGSDEGRATGPSPSADPCGGSAASAPGRPAPRGRPPPFHLLLLPLLLHLEPDHLPLEDVQVHKAAQLEEAPSGAEPPHLEEAMAPMQRRSSRNRGKDLQRENALRQRTRHRQKALLPLGQRIPRRDPRKRTRIDRVELNSSRKRLHLTDQIRGAGRQRQDRSGPTANAVHRISGRRPRTD